MTGAAEEEVSCKRQENSLGREIERCGPGIGETAGKKASFGLPVSISEGAVLPHFAGKF